MVSPKGRICLDWARLKWNNCAKTPKGRSQTEIHMTIGKIREDVFNVHIRIHKAELDVLQTFLLNFDVNYGRRVNAANTQLSAYLLEPHRLVRATFGFRDELLLVISNHHTIQARVIQAVEQIYSEQPFRARADPLVFLLVSRDR